MCFRAGRVVAAEAKEEIFRSPASAEVARLTGCKNISRARVIADHTVEALDWGCVLHVTQEIKKPPVYVGIRAHRIEFAESAETSSSGAENTHMCWLVRSIESPFSISLYLSLREPRAESAPYQLQVEIPKEKWQQFRDRPFPRRVRLSPDALFLMAE